MRSLIKKLNERSFTSQASEKRTEEEEMKLRESDGLFSLSEDEFSDAKESGDEYYSDGDDGNLTIEKAYSSVDSRKPVSIESIVERYFSKLEK